MPRRRVDVMRDLVMAVADCRRSCRLEHQDCRAGGSIRLVLRAPWDGKDRTLRKPDRALPSWLAQGDAQLSVEYQEELVGVVVDVPDVFARDPGDAHVVVIDAGDDTGTPQRVEGGQGCTEGDRFMVHEGILAR